MKQSVLLVLGLALVGLVSCKKDDETPPHEVGIWKLDSYLTINLPSEYSKYNEGQAYDVGEISFGGVSFDSYTLQIAKNKTYKRDIELTGQPDIHENGTYLISGKDLSFKNSDGDDEDWTIEKNENDQLWISSEATFGLIKDSILDTLTSSYYNSLSQEEQKALVDEVTLDLVYAFERE